MTIKELAKVFYGSVKIQRLRIVPNHGYLYDWLYDGKLMKLEDEDILGAKINVMSNTVKNGEPLMVITVY